MGKENGQDAYAYGEYLNATMTRKILLHHAGSVRFKLEPKISIGDYSILDNCKKQLISLFERFYDHNTYESSLKFNPNIAKKISLSIKNTFNPRLSPDQLERILDEIDEVIDAYSLEHGMMTQKQFNQWKKELFNCNKSL